MNIFLRVVLLNLILSIQIANAAPVKLPPLKQGEIYDWRPTASGLIIIERTGQDGKEYQVVYSAKVISCYKEARNDKAPYINLRVQTGADTPDGCYRVYKGPVGYIEDKQLKPMVEKTWPPK